MPTNIQTRVIGDFYPQLFTRSSYALMGCFVSGGVIDPDYRGEWGVIVYNATNKLQRALPDKAIAQAVFLRPVHPGIVDANARDLDDTERGNGGFGSSNNSNHNSKSASVAIDGKADMGCTGAGTAGAGEPMAMPVALPWHRPA